MRNKLLTLERNWHLNSLASYPFGLPIGFLCPYLRIDLHKTLIICFFNDPKYCLLKKKEKAGYG